MLRLNTRFVSLIAILFSLSPSGLAFSASSKTPEKSVRTIATEPSFRKVFIVVLENTGYEEAVKQPFLSSLVSQGALLKNFYAVSRPSQPNYIAMTSGDTHKVTSNSNYDLNVKSIADLLEANGKTWRSYAEDYPGNCFTGASSGRYVRKHEPFISYNGIRLNPARCANIVNANALKQDLENGALADYTLYVPHLDNDGHDTGVAYADRWLSKTFGPLIKDARFMRDMLFIVTFDEGSWADSNHIYTVLYGEGVLPGKVSETRYDFYSLLRTIENTFSLGTLNRKDATAAPITGIWR